MSELPRPEMRLIETEDGWVTAVDRDQSVIGWALGVLFALLAVSVGASIALDIPALLLGMLAAIPGFLAFPFYRWRRFRLRPHGVEVGSLYTRGLPGIETIRSGDGGPMVEPRRDSPRQLLFSEMRSLGHTDYSVWFEMADGRIEVTLENTPRADIARLHDEIRVVWERHRSGIRVSEEEAASQRARLSPLQQA